MKKLLNGKNFFIKVATATLICMSGMALLTGCKKEEVKEIKPLQVEQDLNIEEKEVKINEVEITPTTSSKETEETTKIVEEPKSKVEVNIGGAEVEFTEEELKEPEIDFAKLQEELDRQAQEAQAQAIAQQQALQAQAAAQQAAQAQAQAKQGTDKKGHPYLAPGAQYTWTENGPLEAPTNGQKVMVHDPNTGDDWLYSPTVGRWVSQNSATAERAASMEKYRKSMEGTRKLTQEEMDKWQFDIQ